AQRVAGDALHAELKAVDPDAALKLHANDTRRVLRALEVWKQTGKPLSEWQQEWNQEPIPRVQNARLVGLSHAVNDLDGRIRSRARAMMDAGWKEEAVRLRADPGLSKGAAQALGYSTILEWADGRVDREEALDEIALRTRQFARRQRTWYRKFDVFWIPADSPDRMESALQHWGW
ncbi:MAG: tRNA (adenosine(37)-N6)-dimethylallyltransferase MiaA, partial [Planctomycetes bacterium]|nr:tRNA (adenosine(37)-N6)-dimethylallyltransferase MiaA [Planctomycetota bacterium]